MLSGRDQRTRQGKPEQWTRLLMGGRGGRKIGVRQQNLSDKPQQLSAFQIHTELQMYQDNETTSFAVRSLHLT
jgi:hypothetical protein